MSDEHRRKSEALLRQAGQTPDLHLRGRLIDEAIYWHNLAEAEAAKPAATEVLDLLSKD